KSEHSGLSPVLPRPRVAVGLGNGWVAEASWLPPVTVADATPHFAAIAASWTASGAWMPGDTRLTIRGHGTIGGVDGPVTRPRDALQTSSTSQPCYGTNPSNDTYNPNVWGLEAIAQHEDGALRWYVGAGVNQLASHFQVNFTDARNFTDRNVVEITIARP